MKMPGLSDQEVRAWLSGPNIARLGTINEDWSLRVTALWYLAEADGTSWRRPSASRRPSTGETIT